MEVEDIARGWSVYTEDGKRIGNVVEVHPHYLLVSRGLLVVRDLYVPRYAVGSVEERKVHLAITDERLRGMGWTAPPPPPPPPADSPSPRLVPRYDEDDTAAPFDSGEITFAETPDGDVDYYNVDSYLGDQTSEFQSVPSFDDYEDMGIMFGSAVEVDGDAYLATRKIASSPYLGTPPLVLIHGWGLDARIWDYLTLDLPRDYQVVTYDTRGYGRSSAPWGGYEVTQASRDLRVLLRTLDLQDAVLVGLDLGAAAALHYILDGGQRATRLVLISPVVVAGELELPAELADRVQAWRLDLREDRTLLARNLVETLAPTASEETQAWLRDGALGIPPYVLDNGLETLAAPYIGYDLSALTVPTTVIHGRGDPLLPLEYVESVAAAIPNARLVTLDTAGHLPMLTDWSAVTAAIREAVSIVGVTAFPFESVDEETAFGADADALGAEDQAASDDTLDTLDTLADANSSSAEDGATE